MANPKKSVAVPASASQKQLPNDRESLGLLLRTCERVIEYVNEVSCREKLRLKACTAAARQNGSNPLIDAWKHGVAAGARDQLAKPLPLIDVIAPYISSQYATRIAELQNMDFPCFDWSDPQSISAIGAVLKHERLVTIFNELLACLNQLQNEVVGRLEACDTFCDIPKSTDEVPTDDEDLVKLFVEIRKPRNQNLTQMKVALAITNENEADARSLLRRAQRHNVLPRRRRKSDKARA